MVRGCRMGCGSRRGLGMRWLDAPPAGTAVCGGFDGSSVSDWTAIKLETVDGLLFTPRYGPDGRPTVWDPGQWGGRVPRGEVHAAWAEVFRTYRVGRVYCDPPQWQTEIDDWSLLYGDDVVLEFATYRAVPMFAALDRFVTDLSTGVLRHDGCPVTAAHVANARHLASKTGDRYGLGKPSESQKIDAAVTSVLAHQAACDARASGWTGVEVDTSVVCFTR